MGLVARVVEAAGISTVTLNMLWVHHLRVGMPRVAAIEHPFGRPLGDVGDADTQRAVLRIEGELPSPVNPPAGCHFHPRCPSATAHCRAEYPEARAVGGTHLTNCHLY